jgi:hypothetical protein
MGDNFDDFDFDSGFDDDDSSNFGFDDSPSGGSGFDNSFNQGQNDGFSQNTSDASGDNGAFGEFFPDEGNQQDQDDDNGGLAKKQSAILIVVGVIGVILVIAIAAMIANKAGKSKSETEDTNVSTQVTTGSNQNVDNIMGSGNTNSNSNQSSTTSQSTVITNTKDSNFTWSEITNSENITFAESYSEMTFTVTQIQHKARVVYTNGNLVVKTTLLGSISGLPGTYELDVPYNKGVRLSLGDMFTVHVQLGNYNGKTVVGEVSY